MNQLTTPHTRNVILTSLLALLFLFAVGCQPGADLSPTAVPIPETSEPATPTPPEPRPLPTGTDGYPWWNNTVFYEIFVRSFYDTTGDGIGDLNGVIEKLDYLVELGVSGIWLMPIAVSPSYHGYDVVDYYTVNPEYGTNDDFKRLMEEAHARGIRVIVDLVLNHTSREHPWFKDALVNVNSPYRDWYIWVDEAPNYRGPWGQEVWHRTPTGYYYGVFWGGMPDLNYENPAVTEEMYAATRFWLEEMGVDGFRLDAIQHLIEDGPRQENSEATIAWFADYYAFHKAINPEAITVGEVWSPTAQVMRYVGTGVDIAFEFDLAEAIISSAVNGRRNDVAAAHQLILNSYPPGQVATFLANHDQNRLMSQVGNDPDKVKMAATMLLTSPGVPFIYYGEEIGMRGIKPDENLRLPMQWADEPGGGFTDGRPWRAFHQTYREHHVAGQTADPDSLLNHYRALVALRNEHVSLRIGDLINVETSDRALYAYLRQHADETILVLVNLGGPTSNYRLDYGAGSLPDNMTAELLLGDGAITAPEGNGRGGFNNYQPLPELPARSSWVIRLTP
jgi:glycosidase